MTDRERIAAAVERLDEDDLPKLVEVVEAFVAAKRQPGFLARLQQVEIEGPEDFAANVDRYVIKGPDAE